MYDTENYQGVFGVYEDYSQSQIDVYSLKSGYIAADIYYMISECEQEMIDCIKNDRAFDENHIDVSDSTVRLINDLKAQGLQINEENIEICDNKSSLVPACYCSECIICIDSSYGIQLLHEECGNYIK